MPLLRPDFNSSIRIVSQPERLTSDSRAVVLREQCSGSVSSAGCGVAVDSHDPRADRVPPVGACGCRFLTRGDDPNGVAHEQEGRDGFRTGRAVA